MAHDVFISHSSLDKPVADAACAVLEQRGIRCWIAPRDIEPGSKWGESIIKAIKASKVMVLVFSANSNASEQVEREVQRAFEHGVTVVPLRIEDVMPSESFEYYISSVHWLDALTPPLEQHLSVMADRIGPLCAPKAVDETPAETAVGRPAPSRPAETAAPRLTLSTTPPDDTTPPLETAPKPTPPISFGYAQPPSGVAQPAPSQMRAPTRGPLSSGTRIVMSVCIAFTLVAIAVGVAIYLGTSRDRASDPGTGRQHMARPIAAPQGLRRLERRRNAIEP